MVEEELVFLLAISISAENQTKLVFFYIYFSLFFPSSLSLSLSKHQILQVA